MKQITDMFKRIDGEFDKMDVLQDQLDAAQEEIAKNDLTTSRVNTWLLKAQWDVKDNEAVKQAQRRTMARMGAQGMGQDPQLAIAQSVGADVYVRHKLLKNKNPMRGHQAQLTIDVFETVDGKLLASKVGKSKWNTTADWPTMTEQAVGQAMGEVMDMVTSFWANIGREGARHKIELIGNWDDDQMDLIDEILDENLADELGRKCNDLCEWDPKNSTASLVEGFYIAPAKLRKKIGRKLRSALKDEGFGVSKVSGNKIISVYEVY